MLAGVFDLFGSSHQCWHTLILGAMIYWYNSGVSLVKFYRNNSLHCHSVANFSH